MHTIVNNIRRYEVKGGEVLSGDITVPTSDTLYYNLYNTIDGRQFLVTKIVSKIFFVIPFTYDEYIIEILYKKYPYNLSSDKVIYELYRAEHWNWYDELDYINDIDCVDFEWPAIKYDRYDTNDYTYLRYNKQV